MLPAHLDFEGQYCKTRAAARALIRRASEESPADSDPMKTVRDALYDAMHELGIEPPEPRKRPNGFTINHSRAIWDRDNWTCKHCGTHANLTVDHIIARANGGSDDDDNLQTLCRSCNSRKGAR